MPLPIVKLDNPIQHYAWGSREAIARLQGRAYPSDRPEAELWIGDHPLAPSRVAGDGPVDLGDWIARNPTAVLGPGSQAAPDGAHLPFLAKVLAAAHSLSVQVHPDGARARSGLQRESAAGLPEHRRSYRDASAKHEVLVALSPFEALCGLREDPEVQRSLASLPSLAVPAAAPGDAPLALRVICALQRLDEAARARLLAELAAFAAGDAPAAQDCRRLLAEHPGDVLACAPLLLNRVALAPGEALVVRPGTVHSYLSGTGVEVMTRSDNVVRAGLTSKYVDADELLAVAAPRAGAPEIQRPLADTERRGEVAYETGTDAFALRCFDLESGDPPRSRPGGRVSVLLCVAGEIGVAAEAASAGRIALRPGEAALVPASIDTFQLVGTARTSKVFEVSSR